MKIIAFNFLAVVLFTVAFSLVTFGQETYEIKPCSFSKAPRRAAGIELIITLPRGVKLHRSKDHDYLAFSVEYRVKGNVYFLQGMWGPNSTPGTPSERLTKASRSIESRGWTYESREGVDVKGVAEDGTRWRYLGTYGEFFGYDGVPDSAASYFDSLLDDVCYIAKARK